MSINAPSLSEVKTTTLVVVIISIFVLGGSTVSALKALKIELPLDSPETHTDIVSQVSDDELSRAGGEEEFLAFQMSRDRLATNRYATHWFVSFDQKYLLPIFTTQRSRYHGLASPIGDFSLDTISEHDDDDDDNNHNDIGDWENGLKVQSGVNGLTRHDNLKNENEEEIITLSPHRIGGPSAVATTSTSVNPFVLDDETATGDGSFHVEMFANNATQNDLSNLGAQTAGWSAQPVMVEEETILGTPTPLPLDEMDSTKSP
jgi:hypothetical protein